MPSTLAKQTSLALPIFYLKGYRVVSSLPAKYFVLNIYVSQ
jgi:hypothetical protein